MRIVTMIACGFLALGLPSRGIAQDAVQSGKDAGTQKERAVTIQEVEAFHELLHPLVHQALPGRDAEAIRKGLPGLLAAAAAIQRADVPRTMAKRNAFRKEAKVLQRQVEKLNKSKGRISDDELFRRFEAMHETFEALSAMAR